MSVLMFDDKPFEQGAGGASCETGYDRILQLIDLVDDPILRVILKAISHKSKTAPSPSVSIEDSEFDALAGAWLNRKKKGA